MKREAGYYWVRIKEDWLIAYYFLSIDRFLLPEIPHVLVEKYFEEIDPTPITRKSLILELAEDVNTTSDSSH